VAALLATGVLDAFGADVYLGRREAMVGEIAADVRETVQSIGRGATDPRVFAAMREVPRHEFVPAVLRADAYQNRPLPIGYGQTISQPYIVGLMTALLGVDRNSVVLEIGTGSGYQAAVLSRLVRQVYTVEIIEPLAGSATARLRDHGYTNVDVRHADGYYGWKEHAPYDGIIVTAAATHIPPQLVAQLRSGGLMVIPVGGGFAVQQLVLVAKLPTGGITTRQVLPVAFVPLTGAH
jgi:protein-L-isoaspartate(D-aspartate) O-methyltransferase